MPKRPFPVGFIFIALATLSLLVIFGIRGPEGRHPNSAIPKPKEGVPFLYVETATPAILSSILQAAFALDRVGSDGRESLPFIRRILENSEEAAALITLEGRALQLQLSARSSRDALYPITENSGRSDSLSTVAGPPTYKAKGGIVMFTTIAERIADMERAQDDPSLSFKSATELDRTAPNRLLLSDGGFLSGTGSIEGLPTTKGALLLSAGWREEADGGIMEWKIHGLSSILPPSVLQSLEMVEWGTNISFPEPLVAALGFNIPSLHDGSFIRQNYDDLLEPLVAYRRWVDEIFPGPCVLSLSGRSKFLVFSLPGFLIELPGRGARGMDFVDYLWNKEWKSLVPGVEKLEGFKSGGTAVIPFSILAAANSDTVRLGLIDRDALKQEKFHPIGHYAPSLAELEEAIFWGYIDLEKFAVAMRTLSMTGRMAGKIGMNVKASASSILMITDLLEGLGTVALLMTGPGEGMLEWARPAITGAGKHGGR